MMQGGFGRVKYSVWTFPQVVPYLEVFRRVIERSVEDAVRRQRVLIIVTLLHTCSLTLPCKCINLLTHLFSVTSTAKSCHESVKQDKPTLRVQGLPKHVPTTHTLSGGVCLGNI